MFSLINKESRFHIIKLQNDRKPPILVEMTTYEITYVWCELVEYYYNYYPIPDYHQNIQSLTADHTCT